MFKVSHVILGRRDAAQGKGYNDKIQCGRNSLYQAFEFRTASAGSVHSRHVFDHVKAALGCVSMLKCIIMKYTQDDPAFLEHVRVLFLHASAMG